MTARDAPYLFARWPSDPSLPSSARLSRFDSCGGVRSGPGIPSAPRRTQGSDRLVLAGSIATATTPGLERLPDRSAHGNPMLVSCQHRSYYNDVAHQTDGGRAQPAGREQSSDRSDRAGLALSRSRGTRDRRRRPSERAADPCASNSAQPRGAGGRPILSRRAWMSPPRTPRAANTPRGGRNSHSSSRDRLTHEETIMSNRPTNRE